MLRDLRIQDFALIDQIHLTFGSRLNVLTGETGAGKSILIDAVTMILGGRSSPEVVRSGKEEAVIEAAFLLEGDSPAVSEVRSMGYELDEELVIRRVVTANGKGRVYLNGRPITVGMLAQVTRHLVDLHGQHDHQSLLRAETPLSVLDAYGRLDGLVAQYALTWSAWTASRRELRALESRRATRDHELELLVHEITELVDANVRVGEYEALDRERGILGQTERLMDTARRAYDRLYQRDECLLAEARATCEALESLSSVDGRLSEAAELARAAVVNLQEVAERLRGYAEGLIHDEGRYDAVERRLHELQRLQRKYGVPPDELALWLATKQERCEALQAEVENTANLASEVDEHRTRLETLAAQLHDQRLSAAARLETAVDAELDRLKMAARFQVMIEDSDQPEAFGQRGIDRVEFFIRTNPGEPSKPLRKIASGGELSRVMLALKTVLAQIDQVPTLIFDEVDAGVGGAVAEIVGRRLQSIAERRQVLCVTHLPQVASGADTHILVEKSTARSRTTTRARPLVPRDRVREIARMLAGEEVTQTAIRHAEEMIRLVRTPPTDHADPPRDRSRAPL